MVKCGIDRIGEFGALFRGKRLGMVTSVSGVTLDLRPGYVKFHEVYPLVCLFGPEHGMYGKDGAGEDVDDVARDSATGLPVYSLYGGEEGRHIAPERLETLDAVVYDIQDLGTRFYTFISTLLYVMEDCAAAGRELIVLDRPAPLDGVTVEGGLLEPEYRSFVGAYPLCIRYGLTAGELACMVNAEQKLGCRLTVVPCTGWERTRLFSETGNLWMMPSMGIPHFSTALVYPGTCLFEGTNVSEGRGTACPFEMIGAPFVDSAALAGAMNREGLPGVIFTAACFTPYASKHKGEPCEGVLLHVSDAHAFRPVRTGVTLLYRIREMWPRQFRWKPRDGKPRRFISLLAGCGAFEDEPPAPEALLAAWEADSAAFARRKAAYHLYK